MSIDKFVERIEHDALVALQKLEVDEKVREDLLAKFAAFKAERKEEMTAWSTKYDGRFVALRKKHEVEYAAITRKASTLGVERDALQGDPDAVRKACALRAKQKEYREEFYAFQANVDKETAALKTYKSGDMREMVAGWIDTVLLEEDDKANLKEKIAVVFGMFTSEAAAGDHRQERENTADLNKQEASGSGGPSIEQEARYLIQDSYEQWREELKKYRGILNSKNALLIDFATFKAKNAALTFEQNEEIDEFMARRYEEFTPVFAKRKEAKEKRAVIDTKMRNEGLALGAKQIDALKEIITRWIDTSALDTEEKDIFKEMTALRFEIPAFDSKKKEEMVAFNTEWEAKADALVIEHNTKIRALTGKNRLKLDVLEAKQKENLAALKAKKNEKFAAFCAKKNEEHAALLTKQKVLQAEGAALAVVKAKEEELLKEIAALRVQNATLEDEKQAVLKEVAALQDHIKTHHAELPAADDFH